ncbi:MAG TPA: 5-(carboxyamino)imidazole ribonucleotide synthase [Thermoanaerobaculia bacterium]|nr:5-(carboxyamino)imidazole ribonucleotide synthase [Thermoanaerobaculia bacterium]
MSRRGRHAAAGPLLPGATIGVLGSGQLGRMLALAARRMGYRVHVFSPERGSPAGEVADHEHAAPYEHLAAVDHFAAKVDAVTFEFENVPAATAETVAARVPVRPAPAVLHVCQQRLREKGFLAERGFPVTPFRAARSEEELAAALAALGTPAVAKTAGWGYDGKGQVRIEGPGEAAEAWRRLATDEAIVEAFVDFEREVSVVVARGADGTVADFPLFANDHARHVLDVTVAPAPVPPEVAREASEIARGVARALDLVGVLCVEMFLATDGRLLVNELAPRPHNSGHLTIEAAATSQFEQQLRAVCGLPLGSPALVAPAAAMANLLGDLWDGGEPDWPAALAVPGVALHLYGKRQARPGRKMGHLTAVAATADDARAAVLAARAALRRTPAVG